MNETPEKLREWAARCQQLAANVSSNEERATLLRKSEALYALADADDWLEGRSTGASSDSEKSLIRSLAAE